MWRPTYLNVKRRKAEVICGLYTLDSRNRSLVTDDISLYPSRRALPLQLDPSPAVVGYSHGHATLSTLGSKAKPH